MWASLNADWSDEPRCPDVPNATRCAGMLGSGSSAWYAATSRVRDLVNTGLSWGARSGQYHAGLEQDLLEDDALGAECDEDAVECRRSHVEVMLE